MELLELLDTELKFEGRVSSYLDRLRKGATPMPCPDTPREQRALAVARDDFRQEVDHMLTCNGKSL